MTAIAHIPSDTEQRSWPLTIGLALSLLLHASAAFWFVSVGAALGSSDAMRDPEMFEPPQPPVVELGEPDSEATTITWIGYTEYEEHLARKSETEQALADLSSESSAPTVDEGERATSASPVILVPEVELLAQTESPEQGDALDTQTAGELVAEEIAEAPKTEIEPVLTDLVPEEPLASDEIVIAPDDLELTIEPEIGPLPSEGQGITPEPLVSTQADAPSEAAPAEAPIEPAEPSDQPPAEVVAKPSEGTTTGGQGANASEGQALREPSALPTDRESAATAIKDSAEYKPGKPLASKGLRIRTVRPELSHFTELFASYRPPVARIFFARDGRVVDAVLLRESGHRDVDRNTLDALYQWKAEGPLLEQLRPGLTEPRGNRLVRGDDLAVGVFHRLGEDTVAVDIQIIVR